MTDETISSLRRQTLSFIHPITNMFMSLSCPTISGRKKTTTHEMYISRLREEFA